MLGPDKAEAYYSMTHASIPSSLKILYAAWNVFLYCCLASRPCILCGIASIEEDTHKERQSCFIFQNAGPSILTVFSVSNGMVQYTVIVPAAAPMRKVIAVGNCSPGRVEP